MTSRILTLCLAWLLAATAEATAQLFRVSFDEGLKANAAMGRAEPWLSKGVELVPGKFGQAALVKEGSQLIYSAEQNFLAGRGTLACWCRIPQRPAPLDIQRLIFVQAKERGYWNYLAAMEWQESVFRAMVFDFYHGHGWHDLDGLSAFKSDTWHHLALVWDQAKGVKFFLDGKLAGSTWNKQAWWERPTPHAIHLSYPGAAYDELTIYHQPLNDGEVAQLARANAWKVTTEPTPWDDQDRARLVDSLGALGLDKLPAVEVTANDPAKITRLRLARVHSIHDDKIPSWKVMDGRMNLFWPEWRAPTLGDVDFSGSELRVAFESGQRLSHLLLRGQIGGCQVFGVKDGFVSPAPGLDTPTGLHFLASALLPPNLNGLRIPRRDGMKLQEIIPVAVEWANTNKAPPLLTSPLNGRLDPKSLDWLEDDLLLRTLPDERTVLGQSSTTEQKPIAVSALKRLYLATNPVSQATPLDALQLRCRLRAPWKKSIWWLRVQDPVNPRRDLIHLPILVTNQAKDQEVTFAVNLDFWDIMLDPGARLWIELLPFDDFQLIPGQGDIQLLPGERSQVLKEFAHTQGQLAYSYWQLGSEADGTRGADPKNPGFALLGHITHNRELKLTLEWILRHVPDDHLAKNLWKITFGKQASAPVRPRLQPQNAPEWAVWGRELLERFRWMAHHWADWQGPDGQVGGGWNDDTDFPGVFISLPLLGDKKTQTMFTRIFDGLEKTGFLHNSVSRGHIDSLHATDFLSWRAHLMMFDYGQPRHLERALNLTRELHKWTRLDAKGHRRFLTGFYSEDGPGHQQNTEVDSGGLIGKTGAGKDGSANRNFLRDPLFCAWYSRNPAVMKFIREVAEGDYARLQEGAKLGAYEAYPFYSYFTIFGERKYLEGPAQFLRDRWSLPIWRRFAERLPEGQKLDAQLLKGGQAKFAADEQLAAAYLASRDKKYLVRALREACERLEGGWQYRGGPAGGANDHFYVSGQASLAQMYLGSALTWLRPASIIPPIAVSWEGIDDQVAALVLEATPRKLRLAAYNFDKKTRPVRFRVWELAPGKYQLRQGPDLNQDDQIDGQAATQKLVLQRATPVDLELPPQQVHIVELDQVEAQPRPDMLPDLAVGDGDVYYDLATDRLKVVVHNLGAATAEKFVVRFTDLDGKLLGERMVPRLDAPLDLRPKTAVVWLGQPLLHPTAAIHVRIDPEGRIDEITRDNNSSTWRR